MSVTATAVTNKPVWVDLATKDAQGSHTFYSKLFGWDINVSPDPQYRGYARATINGEDVAGIGPTMMPDQPTAWSIYIGTDDVDALAAKVQAHGGTVVMPALDVGDQGRMAVFQDPVGAFISGWQTTTMGGFQTEGDNAYGWSELNARGIDKDIAFYEAVFGWTHRTSPMGEGAPEYTEFQLGGQSIAGGMEMNPMVPAQVPSYWMPYFNVTDVDASFRTALDAGAQELVAPQEFPGGRFAIINDPQGAAFGLLKSVPR